MEEGRGKRKDQKIKKNETIFPRFGGRTDRWSWQINSLAQIRYMKLRPKCMIVEEVEQVVYEEGKLMQRVLTWTAVKEKKGREESEIL